MTQVKSGESAKVIEPGGPPSGPPKGSKHDLHISLPQAHPHICPIPHAEDNPSPPITSEKEPLSLKYIHKPSRAKEFFEKAQDRTRENSILNAASPPFQELDDVDIANTEDLHLGESLPTSPDALPVLPYVDDDHRLIRKKSGEVLKPLLKDTSTYSYFNKKRTQSLPTTPTYKLVHFGTGADVKYFKKKDRPTAISATNSPTFEADDDLSQNYSDVDDGDDDSDLDLNARFRLGMDLDKSGSTVFHRSETESNVEWELKLPNFPSLSYDRKIFEEGAVVFLERMFISIDKKYLLGHIAVKNLHFEKSVTVRYTLDYWCTIIEIPTVYVPDIPQILKKNEYDRFIFKISLMSLFNSFRSNSDVDLNSNTKSFQLCIKYSTPHSEFWDNNQCRNYEFQLTKIGKKKTGKPVQVPSPGKQLTALQGHTKKPRYSSSYMKRRLSDSSLNIPQSSNKLDNAHKHDDKFDNDLFNSPDSFFGASPQLSKSSRILGTNNAPFNYNASLSNGSLSSIDNNIYSISPIITSNSTNKVSEQFELNGDGSDRGTSPTSQQEPYRKFSPSEEFGRFSHSKNSSQAPGKSVMDDKSYRELLDTYCFFSKPTENEESMDGHNLTTVSSMLGLHN